MRVNRAKLKWNWTKKTRDMKLEKAERDTFNTGPSKLLECETR